jgi:hypothetical protein
VLSSLKLDYARTPILAGRVRGTDLTAFLEFMSATLYKTVFDLVNGERNAENIRNELRLSSGTMPDILQSLRSVLWIEH